MNWWSPQGSGFSMAGVCRLSSVLCSGRENSLEDIVIGFGVETLEVRQIVWEIERAERTDGAEPTGSM